MGRLTISLPNAESVTNRIASSYDAIKIIWQEKSFQSDFTHRPIDDQKYLDLIRKFSKKLKNLRINFIAI